MQLAVPDPEDVEQQDTARALSVIHVDDPEAIADILGVAWQLERDAEQAMS